MNEPQGTAGPTEKSSEMIGTGTTSGILDLAAALDRVGGDRVLLSEIAGLFLTEYPQLLVQIRSAVEKGSAGELERSAHNLKGSVVNFGATRAAAAALILEQQARSGNLDAAESAVRELEASLEEARPALERLSAEAR